MANHIKSIRFLQEKFLTNDHYPFSLPIFNQTKCLPFNTAVTIFVGENGSGKSTLLEALARACGIHIWNRSGDTRCQVNRYEHLLHQCITVERSNGNVPGAFFG
jgi:predicted ATPase